MNIRDTLLSAIEEHRYVVLDTEDKAVRNFLRRRQALGCTVFRPNNKSSRWRAYAFADKKEAAKFKLFFCEHVLYVHPEMDEATTAICSECGQLPDECAKSRDVFGCERGIIVDTWHVSMDSANEEQVDFLWSLRPETIAIIGCGFWTTNKNHAILAAIMYT